MGSVPLLSESISQENRRKLILQRFFLFGLVCLGVLLVLAVIAGWIFLCIYVVKLDAKARKEKELYVPDITIQSMDFTVLNVTDETHLSANWNLLIRLPWNLPGYYMCLNGDFQVLILYKGATIATSSIKSYNLIPRWSQQLKVSMIASDGDMDRATVKDIMEVVKDKGEIRFGSQLILPDCRIWTSGMMKYACNEATLQFVSQRNATLFGNYPNCVYIR